MPQSDARNPRQSSTRLWARLRSVWPDVASFACALVCAALAALLLGSLHGCGGGVGSEGTGSFAQGPISGFGSIFVNGVRYDDSAATVIDEDDQPIDASRLGLGTVVQIEAGAVTTDADGTPTATASQVRVWRSLVGPVEAIDLTTARLEVMGQTVQVIDSTVVDEALSQGLASLNTGQVVEVHGSYDSTAGAYVATRIALSTDDTYRIRGTVGSVNDATKTFTVGDQTYSYATLGTTTVDAGSEVDLRVSKDRTPDDHWVVEAKSDDHKATDRSGASVKLKGLVSAVSSSTVFVVDGVTVDASDARISGTVAPGAVAEVEGVVQAGVLLASRVEFSNRDDRRAFELRGRVEQLDVAARRFVLRGTTVDYSRSDLVWRDGVAADLADGVSVRVEGVLSSDRTRVEATEIRFDD